MPDPIRAALVSGHCGVREMDAALRAVLDEIAAAPKTPTAQLLARCVEKRIADALGVPPAPPSAEPRRRCGPWTETRPGVSTCEKCGDINFDFEDDA